ncbi:MAG: hypothetical protein HY536_01290, partial [Candidatus Colwellbacteria bacterium]|nr:hypothetical protein [Candidatus Colwellbacteria bacterium]
ASAWVDLIEITVRHNLCRRGIIRFEEIPTVEELDHLFDRLILSGVPEEVVTVALKAVPAGLFPNEDKGSPKSGRQQPMERKG